MSRRAPPLLQETQRMQVIDAIRYVDYTHPATESTAATLTALQPRHYVKGADWRGRLPELELAICAEHGIRSSTSMPRSTRV